MTFVPLRTDSDAYAPIDGKGDAFRTPIEATAEGFGIKRTVKGIDTFEVLDAMPLRRASVQAAVETGSAALVSDSDSGPYKAGFVAVDFSANVDYVTATEVDASSALDSDIIVSALV